MDSPALLSELPRLRRYARAMLGDRAAADDLVQDTLERAWSRAAQRRPDGNLRAWLFGIMHNLRIDQLRRGGFATVPLDDELAELPVRPTQGDLLEVRDLDVALALLPEAQRAVLLLVALEGLGYEEAAAALAIPVGTVMSRLARARERLRGLLEGRPAVQLRVVK